MRYVEILTIATIIMGLIWLSDVLFFKKKRMTSIRNSKGEIPDPWWVEYSRAFFPILLIVLLIRSFLVEPFRIPSGSMRPTLLEGDFILVNKYEYGLRLPFTGTEILNVGHPKRGDVIVFKHMKNDDSLDLIKRVVGLPGDHVQYKDKVIYINGNPVKQDFIEKKEDREPNGASWPVRYLVETLGNVQHDIYTQLDYQSGAERFTDVIVPKDSYFVMGDNRDNSGDSRMWGFVKDGDVLGRAMFIWFSWDKTQMGWDCFYKCIRWERVGKALGKKVEKVEKSDELESMPSKTSQ